MANLGFSLRSALGLIPKTSKIESINNALSEEYQKLVSYTESDELKEFLALKAYLESDEFKTKKKEVLSLKYKNTEAYKKEAEFLKLKKDKKITTYFKVLKSNELAEFIETESSDNLKNYLELKQYLLSNDHKKIVEEYNQKLNELLEQGKAFEKLEKSSSFKRYFKIINSEKYSNYVTLNGSAEIEEYNELKKLVETPGYSDTDTIKKFKTISNNPAIKLFIKYIGSSEFTQVNQIQNSGQLKTYEELKALVKSPDFQSEIAKNTYKNTQEFKKEEEFNSLEKSAKIVNWLKYQKSKSFTIFKEIEDSALLTTYNELEDYISSEEFKEFKQYMLDDHKWNKTDDFTKETRFAELSKSGNTKWYFAVKDSKKFDELKAWKLTFEEDFNTGKIDAERWMNGYFWGKMLLNDRYVLAGDKQYYTDNKNLELNGSSLKIITKKEKATGKVWHPVHGFSTSDFNFTSGMLSTAHSYRQLYGKFEIKVKLGPDYPVYQAFWLKSEKILPEIDVFKFNMDKKNRLQMSTYWGDPMHPKSAQKKTEKINGSGFITDYYIYSLEWEPNKLTWKINGIEVYSTNQGVPNEPLYMILSAGIQGNPENELQSSAFEIDWIKCYEKV